MQRRIESGVVVLIGLILIAVALIAQLFTRAPAFEELTDDFRLAMTQESITTMQEDLAGMGAMTEEMQTEVMPALAQALGMTPEDFASFSAEAYPVFTTGMAALPDITQNFVGFADSLQAQRENFEAADAIPTRSIPATVIPWAMLAAGVLAIGIGLAMFRFGKAAYAAVILGVLLVGAPLLMSLGTKAAKADDLNKGLRPIMTTEQVDASHLALATVSDMGWEMRTNMLPTLALQMQMTEPELMAYFGENFPATGAMLEEMDPMLARFDGMVKTMAANIENYDTIKPLTLEPIVWILIAAGALIAITGGLAFFTPAPVTRMRPIATH